MLRQQNQVFRWILIASDAAVVLGAQILAYQTRFHWWEWVPLLDEPARPFSYASHSIPPVVASAIIVLTMMWAGLYRPRRDQRFVTEAGVLLKAVIIGALLTRVWCDLFEKVLYNGQDPSRGQTVLFGMYAAGLLLVWRYAFRSILRELRRRGWNLRHVAIIGCGRLGQVVYRTLMRNSWTGIKPSYFITHHARTSREECAGLPILGGLDELDRILDEAKVSGVFIALPQRASALIPDLLARLERHAVDVRLVPDVTPRFQPFSMTVNELDGMPVLSVRESPMVGWGRVSKRTTDLVGAVFALLLFALPMIIIAILVRLSGPGPVIFRQERASLGGRRFQIYKFRTMVQASDEATSLESRTDARQQWTARNDPRVTRIGRFLRRTSLDELPQLFNVLLGEMSLVGPRPERPDLIAQFRDDWRGYMLRQHVKAGMTGWAQVNGLRGDTSLRKRLQYDLFYIRNWSIGFDIRILWLTIFRGFVHPNAH